MAVVFPKKRGRRPHNGAGTSDFQMQIGEDLVAFGFYDCDKNVEKIPYLEKHMYIPDFQLPNGIIIEVKGYFPQEDRSKMLHIKQSNPGLDIRIVFKRPNDLISKTSKTTLSKWAEKNGFKWAAGSIPLEWLYEKREAECSA